jgi:hypothetical protein
MAHAEEGCPPGQLPASEEEKACSRLSKYTRLPLDPSKPMVFEGIQASMTTIYVQAIGVITKDTPRKFKEFLKTGDAKMTRLLSLHSAGGDITAALELGELIRKARFNTLIGRSMPLDDPGRGMAAYDYKVSVCTAACAYAFLGGVTRSYRKTDVYGLPGPGSDGSASAADPQGFSASLATYIEKMGADPQVLQAAAGAPTGNKIFLVPVALGEKMNIIFDRSGEATFRPGTDGGRPVAKFDFTMAEKRFGGTIVCLEGVNRMVIEDRDNKIPPTLRQLRKAPAVLTDGTGQELEGFVTYAASGVLFIGHGAMIFGLPGLTATSFSDKGLALSSISDPENEKRSAGNPVWDGEVMKFFFRIKAPNGAEILPSVLKGCGPK